MVSRISIVVSRVVELTLIGLSVAWFFLDNVVVLVLWNLVAVLYLLTRVRRYRRSRQGKAGDWLATLLPQRLGFLFTLLIGVTGISAGLTIVLSKAMHEDEVTANVAKGLAVPAVLLAWAILHFGYAERYAQKYFAALPEERLSFPGTDQPTFADFTYFAFTIGVSFAVSDVESRSSESRAQILPHAVLSFLYNTATLGIAIGVITGG